LNGSADRPERVEGAHAAESHAVLHVLGPERVAAGLQRRHRDHGVTGGIAAMKRLQAELRI
jgi:hypothetical protein